MSDGSQAKIEAQLAHFQIVPVVSLPSVDAGLRLAEILIRCGLPVAEITLRTPFGVEAIAVMKREFDELLLLAGTVLNIEQASQAYAAGAECIVIPGFHRSLVRYCLANKMMVCPGVVTPTEVLQCLEMGIGTMKFFPAEVAGGVQMLKAMAVVFNNVRFMPTGGISPGNVVDYLSLETVFCCGGSWLAPEPLLREGKWQEIESRIASAVALLGEYRAEIIKLNNQE